MLWFEDATGRSEGWGIENGECPTGFVWMMTIILFPVLYDHAEGIERLVSQASSRFNAQKVLASAA